VLFVVLSFLFISVPYLYCVLPISVNKDVYVCVLKSQYILGATVSLKFDSGRV